MANPRWCRFGQRGKKRKNTSSGSTKKPSNPPSSVRRPDDPPKNKSGVRESLKMRQVFETCYFFNPRPLREVSARSDSRLPDSLPGTPLSFRSLGCPILKQSHSQPFQTCEFSRGQELSKDTLRQIQRAKCVKSTRLPEMHCFMSLCIYPERKTTYPSPPLALRFYVFFFFLMG